MALRGLAIALLSVWALAGAGGCASGAGAQTTRLSVDDLIEITEAMAASLRSSELLTGRTGRSEAWTVAITRVSNLSSDVIPESEQWLLMERIRDSAPMAALRRERAIGFVIPAEQLAHLRRRGDQESGIAMERAPTHTMHAAIRSLSRRAMEHRADLYAAEFSITDLATGEVVWNDSFTIKRAAFGRAWD